MAYFYLYDSYLQDRAYANQLIKLETLLTDLGIQGRIGRMTLLKSVRDLVEAAIRDNVDTIVAVGNDITLSQVATALARYPRVVLGFIPLGDNHQTMCKILGIPQGITACHVLSRRITQTITLGKVNNQYFMQSIVTKGTPTIECDGAFRVGLQSPHKLKVTNLDMITCHQSIVQTGYLNVVLTPEHKRGWSFFRSSSQQSSYIPLQNVQLLGGVEELPLIVDGYRTVKTPATISVTQVKLKVIVGKGRLLN